MYDETSLISFSQNKKLAFLVADFGHLVPRADLCDLTIVHVASAEHVAYLGHPSRPALGIGHNEHVRGTGLEVPTIL